MNWWQRIALFLIALCSALIGGFISGAISGGLLFVPTAAVFGFVAWLLDSADPRSIALIAGLLMFFAEFGVKFIHVFAAYRKASDELTIKALAKE